MLAVVWDSDSSSDLETADTVGGFAAVLGSAPDNLEVCIAEAAASDVEVEGYCNMVLEERAAGEVGSETIGWVAEMRHLAGGEVGCTLVEPEISVEAVESELPGAYALQEPPAS
jgi:hypothetical protein